MKKLAQLSIVNRAVITLLCLVVLGAGVYAATQLKQELFPDLTIPGGSITTAYPGATGESVEKEVTEPLEAALRGVPGITRVSSTSQTNMSQIQVEWEYGRNATDMESQIRQAVARTEAELPEDSDPTVMIGSLDDFPVVVLAVSSEHDPGELASRLEKFAVPDLQDVPGVRAVQVTGQRAKQIEITARPDDVERRDVQLNQLQDLFQSAQNPVPAGDLGGANGRLNVEVGTALESAEQIGELRLQSPDGPVALKEVADVKLIDAPATSFSRVDGRDALSIAVIKTPDANTVEVANAVMATLPSVAAGVGGDTTFTDVFNQAPFIEESIENLATDGILGLIMAVVVILVFLWSGRSTIITGVSIPLSLLIAIVALFVGDHTLNLLTLSALTISVGRVVDDSIVVIENINRHRGLVPLKDFGPDVITRATGEVGMAISSSTLITVAVFLPIGLVGGQTGELFRPFALTSMVALLASLLVALVVVPVLAYWFLRPTNRELAKEARGERTIGPSDDDLAAQHAEKPSRMQRAYLPVLTWSLRHRIVTLAIAAVVFIGTMAMTPLLRTDFIGSAGEDTITVQQTLPEGTTLEQADDAARSTEEFLAGQSGIASYQTTVGGGDPMFGGGGDNSVTYALTLDEDADPAAISANLRAEFEQRFSGGEFMIMAGSGSTGSQNVEVEVTGADLADLEQATVDLTAELAEVDGLADVRSDLTVSEDLLLVDVDEAKAADAGMTQATIGMAVNDAIQGTTLGDITTDHGSTEVLLRSREPIKDAAALRDLELPVTEKQNADAQKELSDEAERRQDEMTAEQEAKAEQDLADQEQELRDSRADLQSDLNDLRSQLSDARRAAEQGPQIPPGVGGEIPGPGGMPADPSAGGDAQVEQLEESVQQMEEQLSELDDQIAGLDEQRAESEEQQAKQDEIADLTEQAQDAKGEPKKVSEVAEIIEDKTPASVSRVDGHRTLTITATPTGDDLGAVSMQVNQILADADLPAGVEATMGGVSAEQDEAFNQLWLAMGVAIAMVYIIMVATFRSILQPLLLLISVPFAATGAVGILLATGTALGLPAMIGLLMLIGIVVTNAIVLIDLINTYRRRGSDLDDAVVHGARLRLRPIVMTALATIMGLAPMASGLTGGGIFISQSLALVVIGGLVSSTLLTLILVPVLYHLLESFLSRRQERRQDRREQALRAGQDDEEDTGDLADLGLAD